MASPPLQILLVVVMVTSSAASRQVKTVTTKELKHCDGDDNVCVTSTSACGLSLTPGHKDMNLSCYTENKYLNLTCELSLETNPVPAPEVFLVLKGPKVLDCETQRLKNLSVTAHVTYQLNGKEIRSQAHTRISKDTVKPSQPQLIVLNTTENSFSVSWKRDGECRLRFRVNSSLQWTQAPQHVTYEDKLPVYSVFGLEPYTVYKAALSCRGSVWSDWSSDVTVTTQDRVPSSSPEVFYRLEKTLSGSLLLNLMWKRLTRPHSLGYQVVYEPLTSLHPGDKLIYNVTDLTKDLEVKEGRGTVTVRAFNTAGFGPRTQLDIDSQRQKNLSPVRNLWVLSLYPVRQSLLVQWNQSSAPTSDPKLSHLVMWFSETHPSVKSLATVEASNTSFVIEGLDLDTSYNISVASVDQQQCGPPQSQSASLLLGALLEVDGLKVVDVNKSSVKVQWLWRKKSSSDRVDRYRLELKEISLRQQTSHVLSLWPDDSPRHTFTNLSSYTQYSLHLLADNDSKTINSITTQFDDVSMVVTLLLLAISLFIVCILSRTVYKFYFISYISSPRNSATGQWLMDKKDQQEISKRRIIDMKDFEVMEKSVVVDGSSRPTLQISSVDLHEDSALLPPCQTVIKSDLEYVSEAWPTTEKPQRHPEDLEVNLHRVFSLTSEKTEANLSVQLQMEKAYIAFPQKDPDNIHLDLQVSPQHPGGGPMVYQSLFNFAFLGKDVPEAVSSQTVSPPLVLEMDYISNSCFGVEAGVKVEPKGSTH